MQSWLVVFKHTDIFAPLWIQVMLDNGRLRARQRINNLSFSLTVPDSSKDFKNIMLGAKSVGK